jgi:DNA-binding response OmpR family regulator
VRLLVAEDDTRVASFMHRGLVQEGFSVDVAPDGKDAFDLATNRPYDLIVLDVLLPHMDGFEVVSQIRRQGCRAPVLMVSARADVEDRVRGLNDGADDYLTKPFEFAELVARIRALLRRSAELSQEVLRAGDLEMNLATRKVTRAGRLINLTQKELALVEYLLRNQGIVVTRKMIAAHVWDQQFDYFGKVIEVYIGYLRTKLESGFDTKLIHTVRGAGYVLSPTWR